MICYPLCQEFACVCAFMLELACNRILVGIHSNLVPVTGGMVEAGVGRRPFFFFFNHVSYV